jgi:hypothetical protein
MVWPTGAAACALTASKKVVNIRNKILVVCDENFFVELFGFAIILPPHWVLRPFFVDVEVVGECESVDVLSVT